MDKEKAARAEAEAANRVKDEFLAIVSHELRTPLNAIVGWTHLLMHGKLDQSHSERAIQTIDRNATAQAAIISELLDVSRIISGKLKLDMKPVDLADVITEAVDVVRAAADAKGIEVVTSLDGKAGLVAGESVRLQQVIWNLLTNAIKFTPNEGRVEVQTKSEGTHVAIVISDTGAGIPADFLPYVFERFQQADASEKRTHGGLGLGLSIVRNLAEMHGGSVSAESEGEGCGARFTVTLPTLAVSGVTHSLLASQDGNSEFSVSGQEHCRGDSEEQHLDLEPDILKGVRILAVDDQADTRDLIILALTRYGAEVRACTSAIEACTMIKNWKPEVIVSDIGMPDEDGYDLMRKIRALTPEGGGTIPAVALTGYAGAVDESKAYAAGYQVHMTKPVELRGLAATVAKLAGRSKDLTHSAASKSNP
jgi:CheY-like chemotaxis protein